MNIIFLWGRQRSGTNWLIRLILKNFKHVMIVTAWKHFVPRSMPGELRFPLMERRPPGDEASIEAVRQQLYDIPGGPARVFITDDFGLPHPDNSSIHPEIEKAVIGAIIDLSMHHVAIVKHPENWLSSIRSMEGGWNLGHWAVQAEWALALRDEYGGVLLRWEDLRRDLGSLAPVAELAGMERKSPSSWLPEPKVIGSHGLPPSPDKALFRPRRPAAAAPEERSLVPAALMDALGYEWGRP